MCCMKVTLGKLMQVATGEDAPLGALANNKDFSIKRNFTIVRLVEKLDPEVKALGKSRETIITKYGEKNEKGQTSVQPFVGEGEDAKPNPQWEPFVKEMNELMDTEIEIDVEPVALPGNVVGVTAQELLVLGPFVTLEDDVPVLQMVK